MTFSSNQCDIVFIFLFLNNLDQHPKITFLLTTSGVLVVEGYFAYQVTGMDVLYKKIKCYFWKKGISKNLDGFFGKNGHFAYSFFVIDGKIMVDIAGGSA